MNSPIRRVAAGCLLLCLALLINATYVQAFWADDLNSNDANRRVLLDEYARQRGPIMLANDDVIARSKATDGELKYLRRYPEGAIYAPVTGFKSWIYGDSGIEDSQNDVLSGNHDGLFVERMVDLIGGEERKGGGVKLTIDPRAQKAAWDALGDYKGAAVALDPQTGEILAMVSKPSYNPNKMASHDIDVQENAWKNLTENANKPALNRGTQNGWPPGSVFKLVTAAAALESGEYDAETTIPGPKEFEPKDGNPIPNYFDAECGPGGETTLTEALRVSCNTAFAALGNELGEDAMREQAQKFGFNEIPLTDIGADASSFPDTEDSDAFLALSSIGQKDVRATPLQIAMVSAAIANGGDLMQPYLVDELRMPNVVDVLENTDPEVKSQAVSASTADQLTEMMVNVVDNGTASAAAIPGVAVAGKTGTAENCEGCPNYAWFTSFAPADDPQIAVAVFIQEAEGVAPTDIAGGALAGPIAKAVMEAVLEE